MSELSDCQPLQSDYEASLGPMLVQMHEDGGAMDLMMDAFDHHLGADITCTADLMQGEFDRHHGLACTGADLDREWEEVQLHVQTMVDLADHVTERCDALLDVSAQDSFSPGSMMMGCPGAEFDDAVLAPTIMGPGMMGEAAEGSSMMGVRVMGGGLGESTE